MADTKEIGSISFISDTEDGMYHMGEVQGGFDEQLLTEYIRTYGYYELIDRLSLMQWQVWNVEHKISSERIAELDEKLNKVIENM